MFVNDLHEQIKKIIDLFCGGSLTAFAVSIGAPQSTLQRNVAAGDTGKLLRFIPQILKRYPTVREVWLYTGEGPMLTIERPMGIREAVNKKDHIIGDLLWVIFGTLHLDSDQVAKICHFDIDEWEQVMESSRYPTWHELSVLHEVFGINIHYLFTEEEPKILPITVLDRIEQALGMDTRSSKDKVRLMQVMEADELKFKGLLQEYREYRIARINFMKKHGTLSAVFKRSSDDFFEPPEEPCFERKWLKAIEINYGLPIAYASGRSLKTNLARDDNTYALEMRVQELEGELKKVQNELIAAYREQAVGRDCISADADTLARGVRLSHHDSESSQEE